MKRIALALGIVAITTACNPPKKQTAVQSKDALPASPEGMPDGIVMPDGEPDSPTPVNPMPPMQTVAPLLATWTKCETSPDFKFEDYKGIMETVTFKDQKNVDVKAEFFKDAECKTKFTQADADAALKAVPANAYPQELQYFKDYWKFIVEGVSAPSTYTASALNAQGIGEFDVQSKDSPAEYLSYKIDGNKLYFTEACFSEEVPDEVDPYWETEDSEPATTGIKLTATPKVKVKKPRMVLPALMAVKPKHMASMKAAPSLALTTPTQPKPSTPSPMGAPTPVGDEGEPVGPYTPGANQYPKGCGEKASNRATDFSAVLPYIKK